MIQGLPEGIETIKILHQDNPNIKAIASSGYSNDPIMADLKGYGFSGRLPKPYSIEDMGSVIAEVLIIKV
jgi:DNA-binding NarL/FixJ family response regulator